ncbi:hypothetical protein ACJX0J_022417, partial [Zea mays]
MILPFMELNESPLGGLYRAHDTQYLDYQRYSNKGSRLELNVFWHISLATSAKMEELFSPFLASMMTLGWGNVSIWSAEECMHASIGPFIRHDGEMPSSEHTMTTDAGRPTYSLRFDVFCCFNAIHTHAKNCACYFDV